MSRETIGEPLGKNGAPLPEVRRRNSAITNWWWPLLVLAAFAALALADVFGWLPG